MGFQIRLSEWGLPVLPESLFVCLVPAAILLFIYEYAVRDTFIGTRMNGQKVRR